jgi:two-component system, NarL family, response regulator NreC
MSIRVVLADDHRMMREGLRLILGRTPGVEVVAEADNGRRAVELAAELGPDIVVMDSSMPDLNGIEATRQIRARHPAVQVIGLSMYTDKRYVLGMLEAGASGYLLKSAAGAELVRAIDEVHHGRQYLSPEITGVVVGNYVRRQFPTDRSAYSDLGEREREVLQLLAEGLSSKEAAARMKIAPATAETHRRNIMRKLNLHSIAELTKYAIREGLTDVGP